MTLTVFGSGFSRNSEIVFNSEALPTTFRSPGELTTTLGTEQLAYGGVFYVVVRTNLAGSSTEATFTIENPVPTITGIDPSSAVLRWGHDTLTVSVSGTGFVRASQVLIDGSAVLFPEYVSPNELLAKIKSSWLSEFRTLSVSVRNQGPGGGTSASLPFQITLDPAITSFRITDIPANDILYDEDRQLLYAAVSGVHPAIGNTIATIDPPGGSIVGTIQVGSEPGPMALCAGGQFLYVGLYGEPVVQRVDLDAQAVDLVISLGEHETYGPYYAEDLACIPGEPESVAVSRFKRNFSPRHAGVAMYDRDVMRPLTTPHYLISNRIESSGSSGVLYGYENESTGFRLREILVSQEGLTEGSVWSGLVAGFDGDIVYEDGLIFGSNGAVVDAASGTLQGILLREGFEGPGPVAPDIANDRVHFISTGPGFILTLRSFVLSTYEQAGAAALPFPFNLPPPWRVARWGVDGLAYTSTDGLVLLRTSFASD